MKWVAKPGWLLWCGWEDNGEKKQVFAFFKGEKEVPWNFPEKDPVIVPLLLFSYVSASSSLRIWEKRQSEHSGRQEFSNRRLTSLEIFHGRPVKKKKRRGKRFLFSLVWSWPPTSRKFNFPYLFVRGHIPSFLYGKLGVVQPFFYCVGRRTPIYGQSLKGFLRVGRFPFLILFSLFLTERDFLGQEDKRAK